MREGTNLRCRRRPNDAHERSTCLQNSFCEQNANRAGLGESPGNEAELPHTTVQLVSPTELEPGARLRAGAVQFLHDGRLYCSGVRRVPRAPADCSVLANSLDCCNNLGRATRRHARPSVGARNTALLPRLLESSVALKPDVSKRKTWRKHGKPSLNNGMYALALRARQPPHPPARPRRTMENDPSQCFLRTASEQGQGHQSQRAKGNIKFSSVATST